MGSHRWMRIALSTVLLVLLGCGVLTLGFAKAGHTAMRQHMAVEAGDVARSGQGSAQSVLADRPEVPLEHRHAHVEHALHLLGACAAITASVLAVLELRRLGDEQGESVALARGHRSPWSTVPAPSGLGPPAQTLLCVQLH